jgi:hypothetical protein
VAISPSSKAGWALIEAKDHAGVNSVGLGELAGGSGKVTHLPGVDRTEADTCYPWFASASDHSGPWLRRRHGGIHDATKLADQRLQ